ncbi:RagB/SusD family nutrient uptake outer membrane protein [Dyadobacter bucti]|uniref:RagB/SusD family nutrient uptake outer membrane protein n=1 Tax=Dyadobacter bucti TaxID=2572203 RepID=UPI0011087198|nr:RagB/SusD family nutrient uptake outer membrane protein [Dyadobacter bucti]
MRKLINFPKILLLLVFLMASCQEDLLETKPLSEFTEIDTWNDPALIEAFINSIYLSVDNSFNGGDGVLKGQFVDEMHDQWYSFFEFNNSLLTADDLASWNHEEWTKLYKSVRYCNLFLEKEAQQQLDATFSGDKALKDRMTGEVYFLRAYFYQQLVSLYGGVPIVTGIFGLNDAFQVKRDTYADCIKFISEDLDKAAALLPVAQTGDNLGRVTKGAALALKSRVLLYAASDLHNKPVAPAFSNPELLGYTDGDRTARWQAAKDAAKAAIDLGAYSLYKPEPASKEEAVQNLIDMFIVKQTQEDIFVRFFRPETRQNNLAQVAGPNGYHLYGEDTPSGQLVDDFEMADGTRFSWTNPAHAAQPYKDRDPRFYADILYDGAKWKARPPDVQALEPVGVIQTGSWEKWDAAKNEMVIVPGLDTRNSPIENFNAGYTGYYLRKLIDPAIDGQYSGQSVPLRYIRFGEVLLNYAEACIELGQDVEAKKYINMIRKRAGMPDITETGAALRTRYRNERRIELAIEDHRFYDVRRWMIAAQAYTGFTGVNIVYKLNPDKTTATIPTIKPIVVQKSAWLDKAYFFPIMRTEINKNNLLVQNPGY